MTERAEDAQRPGSAQDEGPPPGDAPGRDPPPAAYVADLLLVGVCAWFLWSDWSDAAAGDVRHEVRSWTFMLNLTCTFVLVHRGLALAQRGTGDASVARSLGVVKWVLALVLPVAVALHIEREVQRAHKANVQELIAEIDRRTQAALSQHGRVRAADLEPVESRYLSRLEVRADTGEFVLETSIPGLDLDGYTGRYASTEGDWHIYTAGGELPGPLPRLDRSGPWIECTRDGERTRCG